jgi:hypothetical protein
VRLQFFILLVFVSPLTEGQTLGGSAVFSFLNLPNTPQLTGLGGVNVSQVSQDVGMAFYNPALLDKGMHAQLNAVFNNFYAGITAYHLSAAYHSEPLHTNFLWGVQYLNYGDIDQTDAGGALLGSFRPTDWTTQFSASRRYLQHWTYGMSLRFISSNYGQYRSSGLAADVGVLYHDSAQLFSASVLAKNMGWQLKSYGGAAEDLPFDLVAGVTQRLAHAPFGFSITADHLHQFDIRYNDTLFNSAGQPESGNSNGQFTFDKLFRHIVIATQVYVGDHLEFTVGYNHLRRQELNIGQAGNGLNGFSLEAGALFSKLQIRYARAYYQNNTAYNQFGLNLSLNKYFGLGKFGQRIRW